MANYVAGSLSALFGKKNSDESSVELKSVKRMYEEFEPQKPPKVIHKNESTEEADESAKKIKRKKINRSETDGLRKTKKQKTADSEEETEVIHKEEAESKSPSKKIITNKEAALKRIERKAKKSTEQQTKKEKHVKDDDERRNFRYYEDDPSYIPQTIFIKNLPPKTQRKHIKKLFGGCGDILFVRFANAVPAKSSIPVEAAIKKRSLIKEGTTICAYVVFKEASSVQSAQNLNGIEFEGHHLRVDKREASNVPPKRSIFCGNIPFDTTDDELWSFFEEAGSIDYVRVVRDNATGNGKGIAFVVFKEASSALMALEFSSKEFKGRTIRVTAIEKRRSTLPTPKNAQMSGSKEKINKKKMEKRSQQQERKIKKTTINKQKKERIKKAIKKEKAQKIKKNFAKKLQGLKKTS